MHLIVYGFRFSHVTHVYVLRNRCGVSGLQRLATSDLFDSAWRRLAVKSTNPNPVMPTHGEVDSRLQRLAVQQLSGGEVALDLQQQAKVIEGA